MATRTAWPRRSCICCVAPRSARASVPPASAWSATASTSEFWLSGSMRSIRACWRGRRPLSSQPGIGRVIWDAWKAYTHRAGGYQAQVLLSVVYYLVLGPSVLVARLLGTRLLDLDRGQRSSYWI